MSGHPGWTTDDTAVAGPNAAGEKRNAGTPCTEEPRVKAFALTGPDQPASLVELPDPELPPDGVGVRAGAVRRRPRHSPRSRRGRGERSS